MAEIFTATAAAVTEEGISLQLAGQAAPTRKYYKSIAAQEIEAGEPVLCARTSGVIVVLGPYRTGGGGGGHGLPAGGSTGQALLKSSDADYAAAWATLTKAMVGLGNVDNTSDAEKPISTAAQTALDNRLLLPRGTAIPANSDLDDYRTPGNYCITSPTIAATITAGGAALPYSANTSYRLTVLQGGSGGIVQVLQVTGYAAGAVYIRLYLSSTWYSWQRLMNNGMSGASLVSPSFTGTPTAPTAAAGTNTTQIATTAFVQTAAADSVSTFVRPNLLRNWYFGKGVINQRGQEHYTPSNGSYCIDSWKGGANSFTADLSDTGLKITAGTAVCTLNQVVDVPIENLAGKTVTYTLLYEGGLKSVTGEIPAKGTAGTLDISGVPNAYRCRLSIADTGEITAQIGQTAGKALKIIAAKLELGNTQTLAHNTGTAAAPVWVLNELPDAAAELARCQRYFVRFQSADSAMLLAAGIASSATVVNFTVPLPVPLAKAIDKNNVTISGTVYAAVANDASSRFAITGVEIARAAANLLWLNLTSTGLTKGAGYMLRLHNASAYLDVSAEP